MSWASCLHGISTLRRSGKVFLVLNVVRVRRLITTFRISHVEDDTSNQVVLSLALCVLAPTVPCSRAPPREAAPRLRRARCAPLCHTLAHRVRRTP